MHYVSYIPSNNVVLFHHDKQLLASDLFIYMYICFLCISFLFYFSICSPQCWNIGSSPVICPPNPGKTACGFGVIAENVVYCVQVAITPPYHYVLMLLSGISAASLLICKGGFGDCPAEQNSSREEIDHSSRPKQFITKPTRGWRGVNFHPAAKTAK